MGKKLDKMQIDIELLHEGVSMNWSDMKKIETKLSREISSIGDRLQELHLQLEGQQRQIHLAAESIGLNKRAIVMIKDRDESLKKLTQSVFDGEDEQWKWAAVVEDGRGLYFNKKPKGVNTNTGHFTFKGDYKASFAGTGFDASNWQNSLIERDTAKELTGSDLCRAMLKRGDKWVVCRLADTHDKDAIVNGRPILVTKFDDGFYHKEADQYWNHAVPINNQGIPLTAKEAGL